MNPFWCPHHERTEADEDGYAICLKCGTAITVGLTKERLRQALMYWGKK